MKKFITFLFIITLSASCSDESVDFLRNDSNFPTNFEFSQDPLRPGDILTINGSGFVPGETYIVFFAENITATVIEVTSGFIRVEVPEGAQSGDITLTFNGVTRVIGNLIIENDTNAEFPINITFSQDTVSSGDVLIINGDGFIPGETYTVVFSDNITATVIEVTSDFISVEVPEGAQSGDVTLTFNGATQVIGSIMIENNTNTEGTYLYYESAGLLVELDEETGELTVVADGVANGGETVGAIYSPQTNEYIVFFNNTDPNYIRINLDTGEPTFHVIDPSLSIIQGDGTDVFSAPVINGNGNIYLVYENLSSLVELDIDTGEINIITDGLNGGSILGAIYNSQTNEYIAFFNNTDPNYIRLNLTTLELRFEAIDPSLSIIQGDGTDVFSAPVINGNGNVYLIYERLSSLVELDIDTGALNIITDGFNGGSILGAVHNSQTNEYIAFYNNTDPNYIRYNFTTLEINFNPIDPSFSFIAGDGTDVFSAPVITQ